MILLDTNVISELFRPDPNSTVEGWLASIDPSHLYLSIITETELRYGVYILPDGKRRENLGKAIESVLLEDFRGRILPFDRKAAIACALIRAGRRHAGREISITDAQIVA